jgi:L-cysteine:1D-myo-inositol 2-amino-2-deoxy-alpha-D-glucopyranoside ligase
VSELAKESEAASIRLALLAHHYRGDWEWHNDDLTKGVSRLNTWRTSISGLGAEGVIDDVRACLDDDLDTPGALRVIDQAAQSGFNVTSAATLLGITL